MRKVHDWVRLQAAITDGDRQGAEEILRNSEEITGPKRIAGYSAIKRAFPEEPKEFVSVGERQRLEDQRGNNSEVGEALARRRASREKAAEKFKDAKRYRGPNATLGPPEEDHLYSKLEPGGFNLPVDDTGPVRKGAGRAKVAAWVPGSDK